MPRKRLLTTFIALALFIAGWFAGVAMTNAPMVPKGATYAL